jgi:hypothetical protein
MNNDELNQVAFKSLMQCGQEVLKLVNAAIEAEREACAKLVEEWITHPHLAAAIRARGQE